MTWEEGGLAVAIRQDPSTAWTYLGPGYPLSGCSPAEPDSVSPGKSPRFLTLAGGKPW